MASEAWLINPKRRKKRRVKAKRRRKNPVRRRRVTARRAPVRRRRAVARRAPARRRRVNRRRYGTNPPGMQSIFNQLVPVTAGFVATKFMGNMMAPMIAQFTPGNGGPFMRIASKIGIAYLTAWAAEQFVSRRFFMPVMLGGSIEAIQDFTREYVSPMFPALQAYEYPLATYYEPPLEITTDGEVINGGNQVGTYYNGGYQTMM